MRFATKLRKSLSLALLLFALTVPAMGQSEADQHDTAEVAHVYILSGQSNMVGSGQVKALSDPWRQPIEGAFIYKNKQFVTVTASGAGRFGPEIGVAHYLRNNQPGKPKIYLIKLAISGQPLDAGWGSTNRDGGGWAGPEPGPNRKTFYAGTSVDDPNIGLHYKRLHKHIAQALNTLKADGVKPKVKGIVWMQGEADAKHEVSAGRYDRSLALLKSRLEEDFADGKNVPFVFGQVLPHEPGLARFTSRKLIRQRMADADWRSGTKHAIDNVWMVSTDGMELLKDTVHYSTKGQLAMGQAFGLEMLKAHRKAEEGAKSKKSEVKK